MLQEQLLWLQAGADGLGGKDAERSKMRLTLLPRIPGT